MKTLIAINMATLSGLLFAATEWWYTALIVAGLAFYLFWWEELSAQQLHEVLCELSLLERNRNGEFTRRDLEG